jgi:hypothetical protein
MRTDILRKVEVFVRQRHEFACALLSEDRDAKINALREDLANRGFGLLLDPNDSRFDQIKIDFLRAALLARLDALFEAYDVYALPVDDHILQSLTSYRVQTVDGMRNSLRSGAIMRSRRTGKNSAPAVARAESLGMKIGRATHTYLKSLACEIEKRRHLPKPPTALPTEPAPPTTRQVRKKGKLKRRDTVIFAAILLGLEGLKYCVFLQDHGIRPKWSDLGLANYLKGYQIGIPWRKKIQDEKSRAKSRMSRYKSSEIADAANVYLPGQFHQISELLRSRDSDGAGKAAGRRATHRSPSSC